MSPDLLYGLILLAAVAHATWNALVKSATDPLLTMAAIRLVGLLFGLAVLPFVPWPSDTALMWLGLACVANFAYHGLLIQSYRVGDLSLVYPLARGSAPVLLALTAFMAIDERLAPAQIAAVILITGGILALVIGKGSDRTAVSFALATGLSIATYSFFGGLGVRSSASVLGFQAWLEIVTGLGILIFAAINRRGQIRAFARTSGGMDCLGSTPRKCGVFFYLRTPDARTIGAGKGIGEKLGLLGRAAAGPVFLHVGTTFVEPTVVGYEPTEGSTTDPYPAVPGICASAIVLVRVNAVASAIVVAFMVVSFFL